jgi:hypothetical protein
MRVAIASLLLSVCPALAEPVINYPVPIPSECFQLAERERVPTLIENRYQALKAKYKLARLNRSDPLVAQCKEAVAHLKAQSKS